MHEFKQNRRSRALLLRFGLGLVGLAVLGGITAGAAHSAWQMYGKFTQAAAADAQAQAQLKTLQAQEEEMATTVSGLETPRGVEAQLRERYGVEKPGEGVIQIVDDTATTAAPLPPQPGFFSRVWQAIIPW